MWLLFSTTPLHDPPPPCRRLVGWLSVPQPDLEAFLSGAFGFAIGDENVRAIADAIFSALYPAPKRRRDQVHEAPIDARCVAKKQKPGLARLDEVDDDVRDDAKDVEDECRAVSGGSDLGPAVIDAGHESAVRLGLSATSETR